MNPQDQLNAAVYAYLNWHEHFMTSRLASRYVVNLPQLVFYLHRYEIPDRPQLRRIALDKARRELDNKFKAAQIAARLLA